MKKFILAAVAASVLAAPVMAQPFGGRDDRSRYEQSYGNRDHNDRGGYDQRRDYRNDDRNDRRHFSQNRRWNRGDRFDRRYAHNYRVISSPRFYRLHDAPRGYRWVQSGNDAVLVGITSGLIAAVLANAIN
jgi:Ni/Co efflux regulator RcnB